MKNILILIFFLAISISVFGATILNTTYTGQDLHNNANFYNLSSRSLSGTSLIMNFPSEDHTNMATHRVLMLLPLIDPQTLSNQHATTLQVTVNYLRRVGDYDPYFFITDGLNVAGLKMMDENSGSFTITSGNYQSTPSISSYTSHLNVQNAGFPSTGNSSSITFSVTIHPDSNTHVDVNMGTQTGSATTNRMLSASNQLSFIIAKHGNDTSYQINSISVSVDGVIPEPSTIGLFLIGIFLSFYFSKKK